MRRALCILLLLLAAATVFAHVPRQRLIGEFDAENRLESVTTGTSSVTFGYDADGSRLWKHSGTNLQIWIGANYEEKEGNVLFHVLAGGSVVCTFDATGTNVFDYYHSDHLHSTTFPDKDYDLGRLHCQMMLKRFSKMQFRTIPPTQLPGLTVTRRGKFTDSQLTVTARRISAELTASAMAPET